MLSKPRRPIRTTLDSADANQVKAVKKRFDISRADLDRIIAKVGHSLPAIEKEVEIEKIESVGKTTEPGAVQ